MKKFTSILCALAIVMSASAAPLGKVGLTKKDVEKELSVRKTEKKASLKSPAKQAKTATAFRKADAALSNKVLSTATLRKAKKETITVDFGDAMLEPYFYNDGSCELAATNEAYDLTLVYFTTTQGDPTGEYTTKDFDMEWTSFYELHSGEDYVTLTIDSVALSVTKVDERVDVKATLICDNGNTYQVTMYYEKAPIVPGNYDFVAVSETHKFYESDNDVYYTFKDADGNTLKFDIILKDGLQDVELDLVYTLDDMLANYSKVNYNETSSAYKEVSFKKTSKDGVDTYEATATDEYDRVFNLNYTFKAPEAKNFDTIQAPVSVTETQYLFWTQYSFVAQTEELGIVLSIMPDDTYFGTWEVGASKDMTGKVYDLVNSTSSDVYSGEVVIAQGNEGFTIKGKVLCMNETEYTLILTYVIPEETRTASITLTGMELGVYPDKGAWQLVGFSEDMTTYVSIAAYYNEQVSGFYTAEDLYAQYCTIYTDLEWDEEGNVVSGNQFKLLKADLNVYYNEEDSTMSIIGNYRAQNGDDVPQFSLNLSGKIPAPATTLTGEGFTLEINPNNWELTGTTTEGFFLSIYGKSSEVAGSYDATNLDDYYTYITDSNASDYWDMTGADLEVSFADNIIHVVGKLTVTSEKNSSDVRTYDVDVTGTYTIPTERHYQYDEEADFSELFDSYDVDDSNFAKYGSLIVEATNENNGSVALQIFPQEGQSELTEGEYLINSSAEPGSIYASSGVNANGYLTYSLAGYEGDNGFTQVWFLVAGKATIDENGVIFIEAQNSNGYKVEARLGEYIDAVDTINAKANAAKRIQNGMIVIEKNGNVYNVLGTELK